MLYLATMAAAVRASMADDGIQDMYPFPPQLKSRCHRPRKSDDRAFAKKVEKRRKKNKNKKTHRR